MRHIGASGNKTEGFLSCMNKLFKLGIWTSVKQKVISEFSKKSLGFKGY